LKGSHDKSAKVAHTRVHPNKNNYHPGIKSAPRGSRSGPPAIPFLSIWLKAAAGSAMRFIWNARHSPGCLGGNAAVISVEAAIKLPLTVREAPVNERMLAGGSDAS
jgi:hypothetical protein